MGSLHSPIRWRDIYWSVLCEWFSIFVLLRVCPFCAFNVHFLLVYSLRFSFKAISSQGYMSHHLLACRYVSGIYIFSPCGHLFNYFFTARVTVLFFRFVCVSVSFTTLMPPFGQGGELTMEISVLNCFFENC